MKYSNIYKHPENNTYHVMKGNQSYFLRSFTTETEAEQYALILSARYYAQQAQEAMSQIDASTLSNEDYTLIRNSVIDSKDWVENAHSLQSDYDDNDPCTWV